MPTQLAVDLSHVRVRAVEIDGTAKSPKVKSFTIADVAPPAALAEGETPPRPSYAEALRALASQRRLAKDPAAVALASLDCTFRELELPFTTPDQIDKVVKFEAESHLQLVEIDSVVVSWQLLDRDGRGGSRLLIAACPKEAVRASLSDLNAIGVDPQSADLHLTSLFGALRATGYVEPPPPPPVDTPPGSEPVGATVVALECDGDLTHLLVTRGDTLLAARVLRFGVAPPTAGALPSGAEGDAGAKEGGAKESGSARPDGDETLVVVDDLSEDGARGQRRAGLDFFSRLRREVTRTLFKLGPMAGEPQKVLLMGAAVRSPEFVAHVESALRLPVEVARPFDRVEHALSGEALEAANAEGVAALGLALKLLGAAGSTIEFRQEEVRYARRFDQVKVALASFSIVALVAVALLCIERIKLHRQRETELYAAATAVLSEHTAHAESNELFEKVNAHQLTPIEAVRRALAELNQTRDDLASDLGRASSIPRLPSGLDYLTAVVAAIDRDMKQIGRLQLSSIDLDVGKEKPSLKLTGMLNSPEQVDALVRAIRDCPAVERVQEPSTSGTKDGRVQVSNLEIDLKVGFDPRSTKGGTP
ncbi:MAG: hypothetical protein JNL90_02505 [Planctomycetes bacterium]|nr:hypothetical protein [Planctomycetota bacterium]